MKRLLRRSMSTFCFSTITTSICSISVRTSLGYLKIRTSKASSYLTLTTSIPCLRKGKRRMYHQASVSMIFGTSSPLLSKMTLVMSLLRSKLAASAILTSVRSTRDLYTKVPSTIWTYCQCSIATQFSSWECKRGSFI